MKIWRYAEVSLQKQLIFRHSVGQMIFKINTLLSRENTEKFDRILSSLDKFSALLADEEKFKNLDKLMANADRLVSCLPIKKIWITKYRKNGMIFC